MFTFTFALVPMLDHLCSALLHPDDALKASALTVWLRLHEAAQGAVAQALPTIVRDRVCVLLLQTLSNASSPLLINNCVGKKDHYLSLNSCSVVINKICWRSYERGSFFIRCFLNEKCLKVRTSKVDRTLTVFPLQFFFAKLRQCFKHFNKVQLNFFTECHEAQKPCFSTNLVPLIICIWEQLFHLSVLLLLPL